MRLIDADALYRRYCELYEDTVSDDEMDRIAYMISAQPTAYDPEKIVAELEALKKPPFIDSPYHTGFICGVNYAIDIVRKGGVE